MEIETTFKLNQALVKAGEDYKRISDTPSITPYSLYEDANFAIIATYLGRAIDEMGYELKMKEK